PHRAPELLSRKLAPNDPETLAPGTGTASGVQRTFSRFRLHGTVLWSSPVQASHSPQPSRPAHTGWLNWRRFWHTVRVKPHRRHTSANQRSFPVTASKARKFPGNGGFSRVYVGVTGKERTQPSHPVTFRFQIGYTKTLDSAARHT